MDIGHLKEFVYLADSLSFRQTAEHFYVSRSVISRHLAALEKALGARLIDRSNRTATLTDIGKVFYREAQIILRDHENAIERVRIAQSSCARLVRIGYLRSTARPVIVRFMRYMERENPETAVSPSCMEYGELRRAMEDKAIDIAISVNTQSPAMRGFRAMPLYTDRFYIVMSRDHALAPRAGGIEFENLTDEKFLLPESFMYSGPDALVSKIAETEPQFASLAYYRDIDILYLKVQTEKYLALTSGLNCAVLGNSVAIRPFKDVDSQFSVCAFFHKGLESGARRACVNGFDACRKAMRNWTATHDNTITGFAPEHMA